MRTLDDMIKELSQAGGDLRAKTGGSEVNQQFDPAGASGIEGLQGLASQNAFPLITGFKEQ